MLAWVLFFLGLFPSYVSALIVEKHYTAYWTGFWNLYGLFITAVGLSIDNYDLADVWLFFVLTVCMFGIIYAIGFIDNNRSYYNSDWRRAQSYVVRRFGASSIATSLNWGLFVGFTANPLLGILVALVHASGMIILGIIIRASQA